MVYRILVKWFLLVIIAYMRHVQGFIGIKCVIFEWLEFLVEVQTEKNRKKIGTGFFSFFLGCNPPPPPPISTVQMTK